MILGLQITALIFVLVMVYFANLHYKRGDLNNLEMFFWLISWLGAIFLIAFPDIFTVFAQSIAISRSFDFAP